MFESFPLFHFSLSFNSCMFLPSLWCGYSTIWFFFIFTKAKCDCSLSAHWPFHIALLAIWKRALLNYQHKLPFVLPMLSGMVSGVRKWYQRKGMIILEDGWIVHHWPCPGCLPCPVPPRLSSYHSHVFSFPHTHHTEWAVYCKQPGVDTFSACAEPFWLLLCFYLQSSR